MKRTFAPSPIDKARPGLVLDDGTPLPTIDPANFYSSQPDPTWERELKRLTRPIHEEQPPASQQRPSAMAKRRDASDTNGAFHTFARQANAFEYVDSLHDPSVRVFACEPHSNSSSSSCSSATTTTTTAEGQTTENEVPRHFFAATYDDLWRRHSSTPPEQRHLYEIIRDGHPCHLYFDIEFQRAANPEVNGEAAVEELLGAVNRRLGAFHATVASVIDLESTTDTKFSRHIHVKLDGAAFRDNAAVGSFVRALVAERAADPSSLLFVMSQHMTRQCMVDLAVYSRNRNWRMVGCCKHGKTALLVPTPETAATFDDDRSMFMASLVCNVPQSATLLGDMPQSDDCHDYRPQPQQPQHDQRQGAASAAVCIGESSPFPPLSRFVESIISWEGVHGYIRSSKWFPGSSCVIYSIGGNRYCERIERQHKSNHIVICCNLKSGQYYQKCLDPECKDFRSSERPIPGGVLEQCCSIIDGCFPDDECCPQSPDDRCDPPCQR